MSGFNLDELLPERGFNVARALVGTESTCVTATEVELMLMPGMYMRTLVVVEYDELPSAGDDVRDIIERFRPIGLEGIDKRLIWDQEGLHMNEQAIKELPAADHGEAWLLVQFGADTIEECEAAGRSVRRLAHERPRLRPRPDLDRPQQAGGRQQRRDLEDPRGRPGSDRVPARRQGPLAGLGGLRGAAGQDRPLPARPARAL